MKIFTLPSFELNKRFEYSTGPIGLKALSECSSPMSCVEHQKTSPSQANGAELCAVTFSPPVSLY